MKLIGFKSSVDVPSKGILDTLPMDAQAHVSRWDASSTHVRVRSNGLVLVSGSGVIGS